jgi:EAL domain-containing protein (putative c-di-GMP-specific phosphodiesterase class I)
VLDAEEAGTIVHLTRYVLGQAIRECKWWQDFGRSLQVLVNISTRDLQDEYLPYCVLQKMKEHGLPTNRLTLEVTENSIMQNIQKANTVLECLRDIGVRISMDDFGTGYSSLAQIREIPLHELRIDKSFIMTILKDKQNAAIVRTTLQLAHNMNLEVVAEGVEDDDTLDYRSDAGCDQVQGYVLSRPVHPKTCSPGFRPASIRRLANDAAPIGYFAKNPEWRLPVATGTRYRRRPGGLRTALAATGSRKYPLPQLQTGFDPARPGPHTCQPRWSPYRSLSC